MGAALDRIRPHYDKLPPHGLVLRTSSLVKSKIGLKKPHLKFRDASRCCETSKRGLHQKTGFLLRPPSSRLTSGTITAEQSLMNSSDSDGWANIESPSVASMEVEDIELKESEETKTPASPRPKDRGSKTGYRVK